MVRHLGSLFASHNRVRFYFFGCGVIFLTGVSLLIATNFWESVNARAANATSVAVPTVGGCATPSFGTATNFAVSSAPQSVAVGDFNRDGRPDLVTANSTSTNLSVLLGNGAGSFGAANNISLIDAPQSVAVDDFNRDGNLDLTVANPNGDDVSILLGNGAGGFGAPVAFGTGQNPSFVAVGDFNRDGNPDLVTANQVSNNVSVLLGNGAGNFGTATNFGVGTQPISVAVSDFNLDGNPDLAVANLDSDNVSVLLGNGAGSFGAATNFALGVGPSSVAVGDFNQDSRPDLAVVLQTPNAVAVLLGNGAGSFGAAANFGVGSLPLSVAVGDFNQDGKSDLAVANALSNSVSVLLGNGAGSFGAATNFSAATRPEFVAVGDFNLDGRPDLAAANETSNNVSVLLNTCNGTPCGATRLGAATDFDGGNQPVALAKADFNRDGRLDLAVANFIGGTVSVLLGNGAGGFGAPTSFGAGSNPQSIATADFNLDGRADLAVVNVSSNNVSVLLGNGAGSFGAATNFNVGVTPVWVEAADFNLDGRADLAVANLNSNNVSVLLGNGAGSFGAATNFTAGANPVAVASGDFNQDGRPDLAVANVSSNNVSVLLGNGSGGFGAATNFTVGDSPNSIRTADFNLDGKLDVVTANFGSDNISVLLGNGAGNLGAAANFTVGNDPTDATVGDFNLDGRPDVAAANFAASTLSILLGNGAGSFGPVTTYIGGESNSYLVPGDFNQDGAVDLAVANGGGGGARPQLRKVNSNVTGKVSPAEALVGESVSVLLNTCVAGAQTITVNVVADVVEADGFCSLREAIMAANTNAQVNECPPGAAGLDIILFNVGSGTPRIDVAAVALPTITEPLMIDGSTGGATRVELNGVSAGATSDGLRITAGDSSIRSLVINRFGGDGIELQTNGGNLVQGCYIGTDATGSVDLGNGEIGINLTGGSSNNQIVGTSAVSRNVISGNNTQGISIGASGTNNLLLGNYIGVNAAGTAALGNSQAGINVFSGGNTIGGTAPGAGNVISGNGNDGVVLSNGTNNILRGNLIGTNATGTAAIANGFTGLSIQSAASNSTIGGTAAGAGNVISGNSINGIRIASIGNFVQGNLIGTNSAGTAAIANLSHGIQIVSAASNTIGGTNAAARNVISGNGLVGVRIESSGATGNLVAGNFIGTNAAGTGALGNNSHGIEIFDSASNTVGGTTAADRNIISGNGLSGIHIIGDGATGNIVAGNFIGTDINGTADLGNTLDGVTIEAADNNFIGGTTGTSPGGSCTGACNLISGNNRAGVFMVGVLNNSATGNTVQGNFVGTNLAGTAAVGNTGDGVAVQESSGNTVGGTATAARNLISGNGGRGMHILGAPAATFNNVLLGNFIGTSTTGTVALGNALDGVRITAAANNTIGGTAAGASNLISGNGSAGVYIAQSTATGNLVQGNLIGTNAAGAAALPNAFCGIDLEGAVNNTVGGTAAGARNVISGNANAGVRIENAANGNTLQGNYIGTNAAGTAAIQNGCGVCLAGGIYISASNSNVIGGASAAARNVISGNNGDGIGLWEPTTTGTQIFGNFIGVAANGVTALGNNANAGTGIGGGVTFRNGASNNQIGGSSPGQGNVIANNIPYGVAGYSGTGNAIRGNSITGSSGGSATEGLGIDLGGNGVTANDPGDGDAGANNLQNFPVLTSAIVGGSTTSIQGTLNSAFNTTFRIEFYSNPTCDASGNGEGGVFLGGADATTNGEGDATFSVELPVSVALGQVITATATNPAGNTSEFSPCSCTFTLTPTAAGFDFDGGNGTVGVTTTSGCSWTAVSNAPWITVTGGASGNGNGTVSYTIAANALAIPRTGSMTIAGFTFYVTQAAAGLILNEDFDDGIPEDWTVTDGGTGDVNWTTSNPCNANPGPPFVPPFAIVDLSCDNSNATLDESLITPPFDASGLGQVILQFDSWFKFTPGGLNVIGDVDVSTDGGMVWVNVLRLQGINETPNTRTLDITSAVSANPSNVLVRFHYYSTGGLRPTAPAAQEISWGIDRPTILSLTLGPVSSPPIPAAGDTGSVMVTVPAGYSWTAQSNNDWITPTASGGTDSGLLGYTVAPYSGACQRLGGITIRMLNTGITPAPSATHLVTQLGVGLAISPGSLPNGTVGTGYNQTLTPSGGTGPYTCALDSGSLPPGVSLAACALSGTPASVGSFNFTIKATDALGCMGTQAYGLTVIGGGGSGLQFYPLAAPVRLLDTRTGFSGCVTGTGALPAGSTRTQAARTACSTIPANATAIIGNITVVPSAPGFLTLFPSDTTQPTVANSNFKAGEVTNNFFTVGLGATGMDAGAFKIFTNATADVIIDLTGYYAPPGVGGLYYHPLPSPVRLVETRSGQTGCIQPSQLQGTNNPNADPNLDLPVPGRGPGLPSACNSIPSDAVVLVGNATTVLPNAPLGFGYLTIYPSDATRPTVASSNYATGDVINGPFAVKLGADGKFKIYTFSTTHLVVDISGYYSASATDANGQGLLFNPLPKPMRLLETRPDFPGFPLTGCYRPNAPIAGGTAGIRTQQVWGTCSDQPITIPNTARAIAGNVTVLNPVAAGFLTFFPGDVGTAPTVATSNYPFPVTFGYNRHYYVGLSPSNGTFKALTQFTTDLIVDVSGYFAP